MKAVSPKSILQLLLFLSIAAGLIYWQYSVLTETQLASIKNALINAKWHYLFLALLIGFLSHFFRALRWNLMLESIDIKPSIIATTLAVLLGYLANILIPRLGEIMRCTALNRFTKAPLDKSLGSVIAERLFDSIVLVLIFFLILILEYDVLSNYALDMSSQLLTYLKSISAIYLVALLIIAIIFLVLFIIFFPKFKKTFLGSVFNRVMSGLTSIFKVKKRGLFLIYTILIWLMYFLMTWIAFWAITGTEHLPFSVAIAVTAFGSFAMILTPGGIGAYPPIAAAILSLFSINYELGLATGWFSWSMQTVIILTLGILSILISPFIKKQNKYDEARADKK